MIRLLKKKRMMRVIIKNQLIKPLIVLMSQIMMNRMKVSKCVNQKETKMKPRFKML